MSNQNDFKKVVELINSGKRYSALSLIRQSPEAAAVISKLVKNNDMKIVDLQNKQGFYNMDTTQFHTLSDSVSDRIRNSENAMQLFPDMELSAQILISSILSPKDMVNSELIYKTAESILPAELTMQLTEIVKNDLNKHYKLNDSLPDILRECLFISGSYVKAVLPESSVDDLINGEINASMESISEILDRPHLGILGNATTTATNAKISMESIRSSNSITYNPRVEGKLGDLVEVTDNYKYLKLPYALKSIQTGKLKQILRPSTEAYKPPATNTDIESAFFKSVDPREKPFVAVKTKTQTSRSSVGRPLELRLPAESVIPVYVPGDPSNHIGYFVIIDNEGNPVTQNTQLNAMNGMSMMMSDHSNQMSSMLMQKAKNNLIGNNSQDVTIDHIAKVYMDIIETDLKNRLENGIHKTKLEIVRQNELYRVMLSRTLSGQFTRILYLPADLITYYALKYHNNGTGKSLLDNLRVLLSLRAILLFSKVMAQAKSSISLTHVNMTLDPNDPDPKKTIEMSINEIIKMRQQYFPLGINTPMDLVDWIQRAGFEFTFEGHPGLPQTKFEFESKNIQHQLPDSDLDESLRKQTIMAFGLSPETVDNGFNSEFATTVVSNNILLSKRVLQTQGDFTPHVTDYVKKIIQNDFKLRSEMKKSIQENLSKIDKYLSQAEIHMKDNDPNAFIEYMIDKFALELEITLPKPDITAIENQSAAFDQYSEALDKAITHWVSSEFMTSDLIGDASNNIDAIKSTLKSYYLRKWMAENGYMVELSDIVTADEDGIPVLDIYEMTKDHIQGVLRAALKLIQKLQATKLAATQDIADLGSEGSGPSSSSDYSSDSSSDSTDDGGDSGGDDMGMGDLGDMGDLGGDMGGEESGDTGEDEMKI